MKFLIFLLGFYILLLPCLPCTDMGECSKVGTTEILPAAGHEKQPHENEICNPFCSCVCCGNIFTPNFQLHKTAAPAFIARQKVQFSYRNISLPTDYFGNIWQPPKLS